MKMIRIIVAVFLVLSITQMAYAWGADNIKTWFSDRGTNIKNIGQGLGNKFDSWGDSLRTGAAQPGSNGALNVFRNIGDKALGVAAWRVKSATDPGYAKSTVSSFFKNTIPATYNNVKGAVGSFFSDTVRNWGSDRINSVKSFFGRQSDQPQWRGSQLGNIMYMKKTMTTSTQPLQTVAPNSGVGFYMKSEIKIKDIEPVTINGGAR
jgi:hypothetical protein